MKSLYESILKSIGAGKDSDDTFAKLTFVDRDNAFFKTNEYGTLYYDKEDGSFERSYTKSIQ